MLRQGAEIEGRYVVETKLGEGGLAAAGAPLVSVGAGVAFGL